MTYSRPQVRKRLTGIRSRHAFSVVITDEQTWADVVTGKTPASAAAAAGALKVSGDRQAVKRLAKIFEREQMLASAGSRKS